jgi:predicted DNA-binding transcriptional regulator AlpA
MHIKLLRWQGVAERLGDISRASIYDKVGDGLLTKPVSLLGASGTRAPGAPVVWPEHEIDSIIGALVQGQTEEQIRDLVVRLETERTGVPAIPRRKDAGLVEPAPESRRKRKGEQRAVAA